MTPSVELVTIGDELMLGFTVDTNSAHIARVLSAAGISVVRRTAVGDGASDIAGAVREALERTGAVITTGGLGPTADDRTKPVIAAMFGREIVRDERVVEMLRERWRSYRRQGEMPASNLQQAMIPRGSRVLTNRHGTAPGIWLEDEGGRWVAMLPGVPREVRGMLDEELLPLVRKRFGDSGSIRSWTVRTTGVSESGLADTLGELGVTVNGLSVASLPTPHGVDLRITARAPSAADADRRLADAARLLHERIGDAVYGDNDDDLATAVLELLRGRSMHIAVAESCTGGMLGARLTAVPGSSDAMLGGVIAYDNAVKAAMLGVSDSDLRAAGAVSEPVARAMASGIRRVTGAEVGVAITGIAGPSGGTPDKPVGTVWIAVDVGGVVTARTMRLIGDREEIRIRATQVALDMARRALMRG